jgi:hypothetical protein
MDNRISATLPDIDKDEIKTSVALIAAKLPFLLTASKAEKSGKQNLGDSMDFVLKGANVAKSHPQIMPPTFEAPEFYKDLALYQQLYDISISLMPLMQKLDDTMTIIGQELMAQTNDVYGMLQFAAKKDASLQPLLNEMKTFYEKSKKKASKDPSAS